MAVEKLGKRIARLRREATPKLTQAQLAEAAGLTLSNVRQIERGATPNPKGDPAPAIQVSDNAFLHTMADAKKRHLWPRAAPCRCS